MGFEKNKNITSPDKFGKGLKVIKTRHINLLITVIMLLIIVPTFAFADSTWTGSNTTGNASRTGNVGIGTTTPSTKLEVVVPDGAIAAYRMKSTTCTVRLCPYYDATYGSTLEALTPTENGYVPFTFSGSKFIFYSGNVGIGTTSPQAKLEVNGNSIFNSWIAGGTNSGSLSIFGDKDASFGLTIVDNGYVGIGTTTPQAELTLKGKAQVEGNGFRRYAFQPSYWGYSNTYRTLILGSSSNLYTTQDTGAITLAFGVDVSGNPSGAYTGDGHELLFRNGASFVTPNSANNGYHHDYIVLQDGNVGIGTTTPTGGKLVVNGTIRAKEVKVENNIAANEFIVNSSRWSDFVFEDNYNLPSLNHVESYIKENKHLPDVPSAKEVEEEGLSMAEMMKKQMQKIEELTLYVIEQNKQLSDLKKENEAIKQELAELKE
jgi:hypothetical protein